MMMLAYCLLAVSAGFDSALLSQLAAGTYASSGQPADDDGGDETVESTGGEVMLPAERVTRPSPVRLHYTTVPSPPGHAPLARSFLPLARPVCEHAFRNGIGTPLLC
jgi:hypothetical protein